MKTFKNYTAYLKSLDKKPDLAIIPVSAAAEVARVTPHTIKNWLRDRKVKGVKVGSDTFVRAKSIYKLTTESRKRHKKVARLVKARLIELLIEGETHVFYGDIMSEFGYNVRLSSDRAEFGIISGRVSYLSIREMEDTLGKGKGALLSSMIWRKDTDFVGDGYWGLFEGYDLNIEEPSESEAESFVHNQIELCRQFYAA